MGMAAEANRITYGNWRLSCWAAAFFIHKNISRNGGINMKELWNTAQVIFSARSWSCSRISFIFYGTGSPRCAAFSRRLTPSLER